MRNSSRLENGHAYSHRALPRLLRDAVYPPRAELSLATSLSMTAQPRNRIVVFRLSQDEYRVLKEACDRRGARNLSDFTRSEVLGFLNSVALPDRFNLRFAALEGEIAGLKASIAHLNRLLEGTVHVEPAAQI